MALIILDKNCVMPYPPELGGNRELKDKKKQVVIGIRPLINDQYIDFLAEIEVMKGEHADDLMEMSSAVKAFRRKKFIEHIDFIDNLPKLSPSGKISELKDAGELFDSSIALTTEIEIAMKSMSTLSDNQIKNYKGGSAGGS